MCLENWKIIVENAFLHYYLLSFWSSGVVPVNKLSNKRNSFFSNVIRVCFLRYGYAYILFMALFPVISIHAAYSGIQVMYIF